jgi:transposase
LTRQRTNLVQNRATVVNRLQKVCEWSNLKLSAVATNITGVSARAMLEAILVGQTTPQALAELAKGSLRNKRPELERALQGIVRDHHRFLLAQHLAQIDFLDEQIALFDTHIVRYMAQVTLGDTLGDTPESPAAPPPATDTPTATSTDSAPAAPLSWAEAVTLLDTIPGVSRRTAELLLAEIGPDMRRFPSAAHLVSWAKVAPGNNESAGKRYSGAIGHGNRWLRTGIVQAAWAAVKVKKSYLASFYHRLAGRRGAKRAIVAVAHRMLTAVYHMLTKREAYHDLGATYLDERNQANLIKRTKQRFAQLGFRITIEPLQPASA